jgi:hypothetical protein
MLYFACKSLGPYALGESRCYRQRPDGEVSLANSKAKQAWAASLLRLLSFLSPQTVSFLRLTVIDAYVGELVTPTDREEWSVADAVPKIIRPHGLPRSGASQNTIRSAFPLMRDSPVCCPVPVVIGMESNPVRLDAADARIAGARY